MRNKLYERRDALEAALHTLDYQIANLQPYYSPLQIRCWKRNRRTLAAKLKTVSTAIRIHESKPKPGPSHPGEYLQSLIQKSRK